MIRRRKWQKRKGEMRETKKKKKKKKKKGKPIDSAASH